MFHTLIFFSPFFQAFKEAEHYPGTALIIAYSPCIDWGIEMKDMMKEQKEAVESGYWTLYRYDPRRKDKGLNAFQLDSKKIKADLEVFLQGQNRFEQLRRSDKMTATELHEGLRQSMQGLLQLTDIAGPFRLHNQ